MDWTLDDLLTAVESRLASLSLIDAPTDGRVAPSVDTRTARYYQSLGLLDKPTSHAGGRARYGPRHQLQLVAIKALQRLRLPLADIQARLYGRSEQELEALVASVRPPAAPEIPISITREVVLAPGLRLVAHDGWPGGDLDALTASFRAAVAALARDRQDSGGPK